MTTPLATDVTVAAIAEWLPPFAAPSELERQVLDRVQANYGYLSERSLPEGFVNMVVVSPLLDLAGFYQPPFDVEMEFEVSIPIAAEDNDRTLIKGRIDLLVVQHRLWILIIESKHTRFDVMEALPQALGYMMANPNRDRPLFGLATNGREFLFIQLIHQPTPQYALSRRFSMDNPGHEIYDVLAILKRIGANVLL